MNINSYNYASSMSTLFQSLYNTGSSNSSSMASLTNSILGGSSATNGFYSSLSDYALIKSGSYGKLLKAYYASEDVDSSKAVTSNDIYEKLKAANNPKKEEADKTVTETEDGKVIVRFGDSFAMQMMEQGEARDRLRAAVSAILKREVGDRALVFEVAEKRADASVIDEIIDATEN